jgi:hypothetical protein
MQDPKTGVTIKDRKGLLKTYKDVFTGSEAVDWILFQLGKSLIVVIFLMCFFFFANWIDCSGEHTRGGCEDWKSND